MEKNNGLPSFFRCSPLLLNISTSLSIYFSLSFVPYLSFSFHFSLYLPRQIHVERVKLFISITYYCIWTLLLLLMLEGLRKNLTDNHCRKRFNIFLDNVISIHSILNI
jgi:hypothetical protein